MAKKKQKAKQRRELDLDPEVADELLAIRASDIKSYWTACRQVAADLGVSEVDVSAAAHEGTPLYDTMWGPEGRPRRE